MRRVGREHRPAGLPWTALALALLITPGLCSRLRPSKGDAAAGAERTPGPIAPAAAAAPTREDAGDTSPSPEEVAAARAAAEEAARVAALARAKELVADIRWMVDKGVTMNRAKAGEGDVATKCEAVESTRAGLGARPDPELVKVLGSGAELCVFDVPLLTASESLDHLRGTPSQASRLLMCNIAAREIEKARTVRPKDPKLRSVEARRGSVCH